MTKPRCKLVRVPVAFNANNPNEAPLLEHTLSQYNRSSYIKRLIERDMQGIMQVPLFASQSASEQVPKEIEESDLASQFMEG